MKLAPRTLRILGWVLLGLFIVLVSVALTRPIQLTVDNTAAAGALVVQATPTVQVTSDVGSTDGIVLIAVIIVMIVIIPILLRRRTWSNGKRKK